MKSTVGHKLNPLLVLAARPSCDHSHRKKICQWFKHHRLDKDLVLQAQAHGVAPLLYKHTKSCGVDLPKDIARILKTLYVRHRRAYQVRSAMLEQILRKFRQTGIETIVLKGGALCELIYPFPELRPMQDLDLLVREADALSAQRLLSDIGFNAPLPTTGKEKRSHHLPLAERQEGGVAVRVEIHTDVFTVQHAPSLDHESVGGKLLPFYVNQTQAYTLGCEEMLWHLCHHLVTLGQPLRLIGIADIIGFSETFRDRIEWRLVGERFPFVINTLKMMHCLAPLSDELLECAHIRCRTIPEGLGYDYQGLPYPPDRRPDYSQRGALRKVLIDTFSASEWWLRLYYGIGDAEPIWVTRFGRHALHLLHLYLKDRRAR